MAIIDHKTTEAFLDIGGLRLWTVAQGSGVPVVLCSGGPGCCDYLSPLAGMLDDLCQVVRFDHRGCGRSDEAEFYTIETCIEDLEAIRQHYGIERWLVFGHSFGADLALAYSMRHGEHVEGFVCLSGGRIHNDRDWHRVYSERRDQGLETPPEQEYPANMEVNRQVSESWRQFIKRPSLLVELSKLNIPGLFIYGAQDIRPSWPVEQLAQLIPNAELEIFKSANHQIWMGHEELLRNRLREFVLKYAQNR